MVDFQEGNFQTSSVLSSSSKPAPSLVSQYVLLGARLGVTVVRTPVAAKESFFFRKVSIVQSCMTYILPHPCRMRWCSKIIRSPVSLSQEDVWQDSKAAACLRFDLICFLNGRTALLFHLLISDTPPAGSDPGKANLPVSISPTFRYASAGYITTSASWQVDAKINYLSLFASFIPDIQTCGKMETSATGSQLGAAAVAPGRTH